jgi:hypothetical protein
VQSVHNSDADSDFFMKPTPQTILLTALEGELAKKISWFMASTFT